MDEDLKPTESPSDGAAPAGLSGGVGEAGAEDGASIEPKPASGATSSVIGRRYEVIEMIGSGRRGTVYLARDRLTDARVAVKRLRTDGDLKQGAEYALRAAELSSTLRHPSIARVHDVGEDAVGPFIVSEYVDGPDLARVVATSGAVDLSSAIATITRIGEALMAAHEVSLFHGSVRGSNVIHCDDGSVRVTDFAIAGVEEADEPRARRQDVRGLARTLCQLLTGVSQGTIDVHQLPWSVRPVIRHAMGRSVASRQSTIDVFLRELRASELETDEHDLGEQAAIKRGREAELSGSFAAMREAGEQAQMANAESAEAMVLLRRADALEAEKAELIQRVSDGESSFEYADALEAISTLHRRFPADHHVIRLVGQKRQQLAELTRLRGLGDQLVAAGRLADAVGPWQRVLEIRPDDPAAQEHVRLGSKARLRRRALSAVGVVVGLVAVGGTAWGVWRYTTVGPAQHTQAPTESAVTTQDAPTTRPAPVNPLVRTPAGSESLAAGAETTSPNPDKVSAADTDTGGAGADETGGTIATPVGAGKDIEGTITANQRSAQQMGRDALSARGHAVAAGASGLATEEFTAAERRYKRGLSLLESGALGEATEMLSSARGEFVAAAGAARARIASIETLIGERKLRAAGQAIDELVEVAPAGVIGELRAAAEAARGISLRLADGTPIDLRYVEPGVFEMGSDADEPGRRATEDRRVARIERPYWIMRTELTRGQWAAARGETPGPDADLPVTGLSLIDAMDVAATISAASDGTFSIPTEAQWEYAARADRASPSSAGGEDLGDSAWWLGNAAARLRPVGEKAENPWGLVDVLGNAAELVIAPDLGHGEQVAMTRGGSYLSPMAAVRVAARHELVPRDQADARTGVRLIWSPPANSAEEAR